MKETKDHIDEEVRGLVIFDLWDGTEGAFGSVFSYALARQFAHGLEYMSHSHAGSYSREYWIGFFGHALRGAITNFVQENIEEIKGKSAFEALAGLYTSCEDIAPNTVRYLLPKVRKCEPPTLEQWLEHWGGPKDENLKPYKLQRFISSHF